MFERKEAKKLAKANLKKHYVIFIISLLVASFIGASFASSTYLLKNEDSSLEIKSYAVERNTITDLLFNGLSAAEQDVKDAPIADRKLGPIEIGHSNGVLAMAASNIYSGSIYVIVYKMVNTLISSTDIVAKLMVVLSALFLALVSVFVRSSFRVIYRRIFLEGYTYDEVKTTRYLFIFKIKKWFNVAWIAFKTELFLYLWNLTIIGGIIKFFSYSQVHYIAAENPGIKSKDCINLSRRMMKGHKWELFICYVTFIGWYLLDTITLGVTGILYSNGYIECFLVQYYVYLRRLAIENKIEGYELLNDKYLFEYADKDTLVKAYEDVYANKGEKVIYPTYSNKIESFFALNLGVVLDYDDKSNQFNKALYSQAKRDAYADVFKTEDYPERLSPYKIDEKVKKDTILLANRQYSITTLIMIFFLLSFVGWLWEVALHVINEGKFVNRGVLAGPWLPVYGSGILLILIFLYKFRKSVVSQFFSAVILCGFVEYYTGLFLELTHDGTRWWDYSGYFLNINGRVCAEGLIVFGLGGVIAVYFLAPLVDNFLRKLNGVFLRVLCAILVICFVIDVVHSTKHPNTGEGITSKVDNRIVEVYRC